MPSYVDPPQPPIAIVGIGLRMPGIDGDLTDLDGLAAMSAAGHVAIREIPPERFDIAAWYDPDRNAEGKTYARHAALLSDIAGFDHELFRISPKEARNLDPQQRLLLETTWEGLERAGVPPTSLLGSRTGVYVGAAPGQYRCGDDMYAITGQDTAFTAGRIAYVLGLHGPAITVNTTCSSSLTALHLAVQSLRLGECELALAASAHAIIRPQGFVDLARTQALAPDGWSKTFSAEADGFGRGEGVVALVLAPVERAQAQELPILGLVRGSSLLHDGASRGITAPNSRAQVDMLRTALADAGLKGADIGAVECHGTGTVIGDPIEIKALAEVYGEDRADAPPLILTGLKANVGHLEPAAGLAGLAALLAALKHERLAANPCAEVPNPKIDWANLPVSLSRAPTPWPRGQRVRRAGVSSFGMSGTNAHVIVEEAPVWPAAESKPDRTSPATLPLLLSARSDAALRAQAGRWADWLDARSSTYADPQSSAPSSPFESDPSAIKRSAALHRAHLDMRAAVFAETLPELASKLRTLSEGGADDAIRTASARGSGQTKTGVVFVFPGHGSQWRGMGAALIDASPAFSDCLDRCDAALLPYTGWSVKAVLAAREADAEPDSDRIDVLQPCLFAMGVALASVWRDELGISPDAVLGHSVGEIAAAVVAGALSLDDGARLVALRGRLIAAVGEERDPGAMLAVAAPSEEVRERLAPWRDVLCIAVVNAPEACVVAGERDALGQLQDALEGERTACRRVAIGFGAHSPLMDPILEPFVDGLQDLAPRSAELSFFSPIDGGARDGATLDAAYWRENVRATVRFDRAIAAANAEGHRVFIELGGHPVLGRPMAGAVADGVVVGSLRRGEGDIGILHRALGELHCAGVGIDWRRVLGSGPVVALPTYAFQRRRHWVEQPVRPAKDGAPAPSPNSPTLTASAPRYVQPTPVAAQPPMPAVQAAAAPATPHPGGAGFMVEQLRVFTELTRRQIDIAAAYAQPASPVAASASPTPLDALSMRMTDALQPALVGIEDTERRLELAALDFTRTALGRLGLRLEQGQRFTSDWLIERLAIVPAHQRLAARLCVLLAEAGDLMADHDGWTVARPLSPTDMASSAEPVAGGDARMELLCRCGARLDEVLTGRQSPLGLLFPDGDPGLVGRVYTESAPARAFNALVADAAASLISLLPRRAHVLEIGAGTGGTTASVLPGLPAERVAYTFTDVGASFLPAARAKFAAYPFIDYRPLDIERSPGEQGFEGGSQDLILAANVLHATADLTDTLRNALELLAPGGFLVLLENVRRRAWVDLTFGLTTGWWRFEDRALRPDYPLLDAARWRALLADLGLTESACVTHPASEMGIIIARKP